MTFISKKLSDGAFMQNTLKSESTKCIGFWEKDLY